MRKNSVKNRRINDEVRKSLAEIIRNIKDPRVSVMTSVMEAEVAPDLKNCKVWIIAYGVEMAHRIDEVKAMDEEAERERREKGIDINDVSAYDDMTGDEEE